MTNQWLIEEHLARARELEVYAQRLEAAPLGIRVSPRWRDAAFLRRQAESWRGHAGRLARAT